MLGFAEAGINLEKFVKNLILAGALFGLLFMLTACQGEQSDTSDHVAALPQPQVRVDKLPTATPIATHTPDPATPEAPALTAIPQAQVQPWPTLDEEAHWLSEIETLLSRIERRLNSTDTRLKP